MIDVQYCTPCQLYGHRYTLNDDPEVFDSCVDCGEPRETDE